MVVKSLKPLFILFSETILFFLYPYQSPVSVLLFSIRTNFMYQYHFFIFVPITCIDIIFQCYDTQ